MTNSVTFRAGELSSESKPGGIWRFFVIDTGADTARAIRAAGRLARGLNAEMILLAPIEVPFPIPLEEPPVSLPFLREGWRKRILEADLWGRVELLLCRDRRETIRRALPDGAVVVLAGSWRCRTLARQLMKDGHKVFFVKGDR